MRFILVPPWPRGCGYLLHTPLLHHLFKHPHQLLVGSEVGGQPTAARHTELHVRAHGAQQHSRSGRTLSGSGRCAVLDGVRFPACAHACEGVGGGSGGGGAVRAWPVNMGLVHGDIWAHAAPARVQQRALLLEPPLQPCMVVTRHVKALTDGR